MAGDGVREGQEISSRIREELERIRESEGRVEEALEAVRQARRRVEVIARELGREAAGPPVSAKTSRSDPSSGWAAWREPAAAAPPGSPEPPLPAPPPAAPVARAPEGIQAPKSPNPQPGSGRRRRVTAVGLSVAAVAVVGWFAIRGLRQGSEVQGVDPAPGASTPIAAPKPAPVSDPSPPLPLNAIPTDPALRLAFYDSLVAARSSLFEPLLEAVDSGTSDRAVKRAIARWREGPVDAQDADLVHSAILQHELKGQDSRIEIDG